MQDPYEILGCTKETSAEDLKKIYNKLVLKYHPDRKTGDIKKYQEIKLGKSQSQKK